MRATGFDPAVNEYQPGRTATGMSWRGIEVSRLQCGKESVFRISQSHTQVEQVLEKAVALGRKARDEGWTEDQLATEYAGFVKRKGKDPRPSKAKKRKS